MINSHTITTSRCSIPFIGIFFGYNEHAVGYTPFTSVWRYLFLNPFPIVTVAPVRWQREIILYIMHFNIRIIRNKMHLIELASYVSPKITSAQSLITTNCY